MEELYNLGISDNTISQMLELNHDLKEITKEELNEKLEILKTIGCSENQIRNIISSNALYLNRTNQDIKDLLHKLNSLGFTTLNILFDSNPYILNIDPYEIDNYINNRLNNGEYFEDIINDLDTNTYLFNEM